MLQDAILECAKTMSSSDIPIEKVITETLLGFKKIGVDQDMIEKYIGHPVKNITRDEIVELFGVFNAIKEKSATRDDYLKFKDDDMNSNNSDIVDNKIPANNGGSKNSDK